MTTNSVAESDRVIFSVLRSEVKIKSKIRPALQKARRESLLCLPSSGPISV